MARHKLSILIAGMVAADPHQGGATWAVLQYVLGLARLGHEVVLVDPVSLAAIRPDGAALGESENAGYFRQLTEDFALPNSALLLAGTQDTVGLSYAELRKRARAADLLLNINGMLMDEELLAGLCRRVSSSTSIRGSASCGGRRGRPMFRRPRRLT